MTELATEAAVDNSKLFRKIVRDFNESRGFNFKLPKDTDFSSQYAHPVHEDEHFKITSQTDDKNVKLYALRIERDGFIFELPDEMSYEQLLTTYRSDAFKQRMSYANVLNSLHQDLSEKLQQMKYDIFEQAMKDSEIDELYDTITTTARTLYKRDTK